MFPTFPGERPFVNQIPAPANLIELFAGQWASKFPKEFSDAPGQGSAGLFDDERIRWADAQLRGFGGGVAGSTVLELGPLEGGHTYMLAKILGAKQVVAVEANGRAYLKCLVAKEMLQFNNARFLLGDAVEYMKAQTEVYDVGIACAFLNHLTNPIEMIELLAQRCRSVFVWNVVYHSSLFERQPALRPTFGPPQHLNYKGFSYTLHPHTYGPVGDFAKFWGGCQSYAGWLEASDILRALEYFGLSRISSKIEENDFGKAAAVVAARPGETRQF
jgi:hypothetical protein